MSSGLHGDLGLVTRWAFLIRMGAMRGPEDRISYQQALCFVESQRSQNPQLLHYQRMLRESSREKIAKTNQPFNQPVYQIKFELQKINKYFFQNHYVGLNSWIQYEEASGAGILVGIFKSLACSALTFSQRDFSFYFVCEALKNLTKLAVLQYKKQENGSWRWQVEVS